VKIPGTAAPKDLTEQTLVTGTGTTVAAGDTLVANYVGETWATKPNVFDSSFSRGEPAGFVIGEGQVIPGWDKTLVGKKLGTRVLLTIPPADGYGSTGNSQAGIGGTDTLVFVVDLVATYKPDASAPGVVDSDVPATGWPKVTNVPGKQPAITSVAGVKAPTAPASKLLVKGTGAKIVSTKTLVLQLVQTDIATGKSTQVTWGQAPQLAGAAQVVALASALAGQSIGARAVALLPAEAAVAATATAAAQPAEPAQVLVIDVVGQF
jgi:peptidylprolyl isomerase